MFIPKKYGRKALKKQPTYAKKRRSTVSQAVKQYVKRTMHVDQENKLVNFNPAPVRFGNYLDSNSLYIRPILPYPGFSTIPQGVTQGTRVGNEIKTRKVTLNYVLRPMPYSATTPGNAFPAPVEVDLFLGNLKACPGVLPGPSDMTFLFQGGATAYAPVGNLTDLIADVNKDYWNIKKRWRHKIGYANNQGTGSIANNQFFANNDFKMNVVKKLNITKLCPKTMKFNDGDATLQGANLFFFFQCVNSGGGINAAFTQPCNIDYWVSISYEDA